MNCFKNYNEEYNEDITDKQKKYRDMTTVTETDSGKETSGGGPSLLKRLR